MIDDLKASAESLPQVLPVEERDLDEVLALTHRAYSRNVALGFRYTGASEPMESLRHSWAKERIYKLVLNREIVGTVRLIEVDGRRVWLCECVSFRERATRHPESFCAHTAVAIMRCIHEGPIQFE